MKRFALLLLPFFLSLSAAPALDIYWIEGCEGHWIRASIAPDGSYSLTNNRNGVSRNYKSK